MQAYSTDSDNDDHYKVLSLPRPRNVSSSNISKDEVKLAYHRTLLLHHPDKVKNSTVRDSSKEHDTSTTQKVYSIDQITRAYQTLADPIQRVSYDKTLLTPSANLQNPLHTGSHLGVETFDLEDLEYHEKHGTWSKTCRCGSDEGYILTEAELEKESSEGEVYVGCRGCSLFIKVLFGVEEASNGS